MDSSDLEQELKLLENKINAKGHLKFTWELKREIGKEDIVLITRTNEVETNIPISKTVVTITSALDHVFLAEYLDMLLKHACVEQDCDNV